MWLMSSLLPWRCQSWDVLGDRQNLPGLWRECLETSDHSDPLRLKYRYLNRITVTKMSLTVAAIEKFLKKLGDDLEFFLVSRLPISRLWLKIDTLVHAYETR